MSTPQDVLTFWFDDENQEKHFVKDEDFDATIRDKFLTLHMQAAEGLLSGWEETPEGALALVILLDQFSRNMFRGSRKMFKYDNQALAIAERALEKGFDQKLTTEQRIFLYMPFMHSEDIHKQNKGRDLYTKLGEPKSLDYMIRHRDIIKRFGRFPHRNAILERQNTPEEKEFLKQPGSSF